MFYLSRTGTTEGPFTESVIIDMIKSRLAESGHICPVGGQEWVALGAHPPFAAALEERARRESAPPASVRPPASVAPAAPVGPSAPIVAAAPVAPSFAPQNPSPALTPSGMGPVSFVPPTPTPAHPSAPSNYQAAPSPSFGPHPSQGAHQPSHHPSQPSHHPSHHPSQPSHHPASFSPMPPAAGYGPPPGSSFPQNPAFNPYAVPPQKKSNVGLIVAGVFGALLVVGGGAAAAAYFFLFNTTPLAGYFPENTQVYAEVGNVKRSALALAAVSIIDPSKVDEKTALEDAKAGIASAFDLSKDDAARVALGIQGFAIGGREEGGKGAAMVVAFDDTKSAETLLKSSRFSEIGEAGKAGKRYSLKRRELSFEQRKGLGVVERTLSSLELTTDKTDQLVWFPKKKVLVVTDQKVMDDTFAAIESGKSTLLQNKAFAAQKSRFGGPGVAAYVDTGIVTRSEKAQDLKKYFQDVGPILVSAVPEKAGIRMTMTGEISGVEGDMSRIDSMLDAPGLTLSKQLPKETVAYLAFSSKTKLSGKEARDAFFKGLNKEKATEGLQKSVEEGEQALGADLTTVFDALGDEGAIAAVARPGYRYEKGKTPTFDDFAVVYAQKIRDVAAAKKLVGVLREKGGGKGSPFKLTAKGDDVVAEAEKPFPRVEIRFLDGRLVAVAGAKDLADRTYAAMSGTGTLGDDAAHKSAIADLDAKHLLLWVDLGRVGENVLAAQPELKAMSASSGLDLGALVLAGDKRATGALGITLRKQGTKLGYTVDSMNLPIAAGAGAALAPSLLFSRGTASLDSKDAPPPGTLRDSKDAKDPKAVSLTSATLTPAPGKGGATVTLAPAGDLPALCETALTRYDRCVYKAIPAAHRGRVVKALRDGMSKQTNESRPRYCQALIDAAERSHPGCQ